MARLTILVASALLAAACAGGSGDDPPTTPAPVACTASAECTAGQICAAGACGACQAAAQCADDYGEGATCVSGACQKKTCEQGKTGCPCYPNGTCDSGACEDKVCVACVEGSTGCPCYPNNTCDTGACEAGVCQACAAGTVGCKCGEGDTCTNGRCDAGQCVSCTDAVVGCPCATGACVEGLCVDGTCAPCVDGVIGCKCTAASTCTGGRCDAGTCVACEDGVVGCPCDKGACPDARCVESLCVPCIAGADGCPCGEGDSCDGGHCKAGTCEPCTVGAIGCPCATTGEACPGGRCIDAICAPCVDGLLECPCAGATCTEGQCVTGTCTDCVQGQDACTCFANDTCATGLQCLSDLCAPCPAATKGCPCGAGEACLEGLKCAAGLCVDGACQDGTKGCPCVADDACTEALTACDNALCVACDNHLAGCPCDQGLCQGDLLCEDDLCRAPKPCEDVCLPHQTCTSATGKDPVCEESCEDGWQWKDGGCELSVPATCTPGAPGSIEADCAEKHRVCEPGESGATCGACVDFYTDEAGVLDVCRPVYTCQEVNCEAQHRECAAETATADAACGACLPSFIADGDLCRAVKTCSEVGCATKNQSCTAETTTSDATCGACLPFYLAAGEDCVAVKTCKDLGCTSLHRTCAAETESADASCGGCLAFFIEDDSACRAAYTCDDQACAAAKRTCTAETETSDAECGGCLSGYIEDSATCRAIVTCEAAGCAANNRQCTAETETTDAVCGACQDYFVDDGSGTGACAPVKTCTDAGCAALNKECTAETTTADAVCGACLPDFVDGGGFCQLPAPTCAAGVPGSILDTCEVALRNCDEPIGQSAECGDCKDGYAENAKAACTAIATCEGLKCQAKLRQCLGAYPFQSCGDCFEGTVPGATDNTFCEPPKTCDEVTCDEDEFCIEGDGKITGASCVFNSCLDGEAYSDYAGKCVSCIVACGDDEGETGKVWPVTLDDSQACICETADGYYWDEGGVRSARPCDADGDGWVRDGARSYLESEDPALWQNARCNLKTIDRVVLENELGQRMSVYICDGDPPFIREGTAEECEFGYLDVPLYESTRNDDQAEAAQDSLVPAYTRAGTGRRLTASELNPFTRACQKGSDLNDNGLTDIHEWHGMSQGDLSTEEYIFASFSFFMELHRGFYETGTESLTGQYVIQERSRCDEDFPIDYGTTTSTYWQGCTRSRAAAWDATDGDEGPDFGYDFAQWSCDETSGSCPIPPPPTDAVPGTTAPSHDLCTAYKPIADDDCDDPTKPWLCIDGSVWRGMNHSSQFRCVVVDDDASVVEPHEASSGFYPAYDGELLLSQCRVECPEEDPTCATDCTDGVCTSSSLTGSDAPSDPVLGCEVNAAPIEGDIGFAVVLFKEGASGYSRGCIDEWTPTKLTGNVNGADDDEVSTWRSLCPGYTSSPDTVTGQGNQLEFGEIQCGCGNNYGGIDCDAGCPSELLHLDPTYATTPRSGYWMCGDFAASGFDSFDDAEGAAAVGTDTEGAKWVLRGESEGGAYGDFLCETATCTALGLNASNYGSSLVCGLSPDCDAAEKTYEEATTLCAANGMRLCTLAELGSDEARASGCGFDWVRAWTSTACADGHQTQAGASHDLANNPLQCTADTGTAAVRCCADACSETGYRIR